MSQRILATLALCLALLLPGCAIYNRHGLPPEQAAVLQSRPGSASFKPSPELEKRIRFRRNASVDVGVFVRALVPGGQVKAKLLSAEFFRLAKTR